MATSLLLPLSARKPRQKRGLGAKSLARKGRRKRRRRRRRKKRKRGRKRGERRIRPRRGGARGVAGMHSILKGVHTRAERRKEDKYFAE